MQIPPSIDLDDGGLLEPLDLTRLNGFMNVRIESSSVSRNLLEPKTFERGPKILEHKLDAFPTLAMSDSKLEVIEHGKKPLDNPSRSTIRSRSLINATALPEIVELSLQPLQVIQVVALFLSRRW
jgi:hypothetical protein